MKVPIALLAFETKFLKVLSLLGGELSDKEQMSWKLQNFQALTLLASDLPISTVLSIVGVYFFVGGLFCS